MTSTYTIGAAHETFGTEGQALYRGSKADAVAAATTIATQAGHGWTPYVLDEDGNAVETSEATE